MCNDVPRFFLIYEVLQTVFSYTIKFGCCVIVEVMKEGVTITMADGVRSVFGVDVDGGGDVDILSASWDDDTIVAGPVASCNTEVTQNHNK